jgi:hypothetical protein
MYNLKRNTTTVMYYCTKLNQKQVHSREIVSLNLPRNALIEVTLVARPLLTPLAQKLCNANMMYSRAERVFILEHYFTSKSSAAVREKFGNADKEVPNKTIQRLVTTFRGTGSVCL